MELKFTGERVVPECMGVDIKTYNEHLARYIFALPYCVNKKVLDAACGTGYGSYILSSVATDVQGVDVDRKTIEYANLNFKSFFSYINFNICDFERDFFSSFSDSKKYDVIISFETIEHLENPEFFLSNIQKSLSPGGKFIFSIPRMSFVKFHKNVYNLKDAQELIYKFFPNCKWYSQNNFKISYLNEFSQFFLGVATK